MKNWKYFILFLATSVLCITACKKEDSGPANLTVSTIIAKGTSFQDGSTVEKDLNGASSATDVALNSIITITFDRNVDGGSVNGTTVKLTSAAGTISATVTSSGATVTLTPDADLERGSMHTLQLSGLKATDGGTFTATSRSFTH